MREAHGSRLWVVPVVALVVLLGGRHELLTAAAAAPAHAAEQQPVHAGILQFGQEVYRSQCEPCHGKQGRGDGPAARFLESQPRDLTADEWESVSDRTVSEVTLVVRNGIEGTEMEPFEDLLEEDEILAVAAYVIETFVKQSAAENDALIDRMTLGLDSVRGGRRQ